MALIEVKVPQLSESVAEATLLQWHKKAGDPVERDENMIDIETDKVVLELPAPSGGVIVEVVKPDGATVVAGEVIAVIDTEGKAGEVAAGLAPAAATPTQAERSDVAGDKPAPVIPAPGSLAEPAPAPAGLKGNVAMPAAAKLMAESNLGSGQVQGTGRDGRITKSDVLAAVSSGAAIPAAVMSAPRLPAGSAAAALPQVKAPVDLGKLLEGRPEQRVPMSRLRLRVAERLLQSQAANAILTTFNEVNMQPVIDLRKRYQDRFEKEHGTRLGFMSFFVKAAVHALKK
ncbi:MAG: biotin/lipoyl-containing protein, partial [Quisquiliibacterium sp.]